MFVPSSQTNLPKERHNWLCQSAICLWVNICFFWLQSLFLCNLLKDYKSLCCKRRRWEGDWIQVLDQQLWSALCIMHLIWASTVPPSGYSTCRPAQSWLRGQLWKLQAAPINELWNLSFKESWHNLITNTDLISAHPVSMLSFKLIVIVTLIPCSVWMFVVSELELWSCMYGMIKLKALSLRPFPYFVFTGSGHFRHHFVN